MMITNTQPLVVVLVDVFVDGGMVSFIELPRRRIPRSQPAILQRFSSSARAGESPYRRMQIMMISFCLHRTSLAVRRGQFRLLFAAPGKRIKTRASEERNQKHIFETNVDRLINLWLFFFPVDSFLPLDRRRRRPGRTDPERKEKKVI